MLVERRHIDARHCRKCQQELCARHSRCARPRVRVHERGHDDLALADNEGIDDERQRLGIERRAGTARDDDGILLRALRRAQADLPQLKHLEHIEIIHLEGDSKADERELIEWQLVLDAHERRARLLIARNVLPLRQEKPLACRIPPLVEQIVNDMEPEVRHANEIGIRIDQREPLPRSRCITVVSLFACEFFLKLPLEFPVHCPTPCRPARPTAAKMKAHRVRQAQSFFFFDSRSSSSSVMKLPISANLR